MNRPKTDMEFYSIVGPVYGAGPMPEPTIDAPVCEICGDPTTDKDSHGTLMCLDCQEDEVQHEDCQGYQGGCGSPSCLSCNPPEPCCYTWYRTRHQQHDYDCEEYDR